MKIKSILATLVAVCVATVATAQNEFGKGDAAININYGFGSFDGVDASDGSVFMNSLGASVEFGIMEGLIKGKGTVAVGAQVGLGFGAEKFQNVDLNCTRIRIATRGVFHYQFVPQLDTYAGITLGIVDINKYKYDGDYRVTGDNFDVTMNAEVEETDADFIYPVAFAGARYMFSNSFGLNMEVSWDSFAIMSVGVTFKL